MIIFNAKHDIIVTTGTDPNHCKKKRLKVIRVKNVKQFFSFTLAKNVL